MSSSSTIQFGFEEFLKSISIIVDLDQLLDNFSAKVREIAGANSVFVVLSEPVTDRYLGKKAKGVHAELLGGFSFSRSDNLVKWLTVNRTVLHVKQDTGVVAFLSPLEQKLLHEAETSLVIPLVVANRLTGAVFIGEETNGRAYGSTEIGAITWLIAQASLAIERAVMYEFEEHRLKRMFHADKLATVGELAAGAAHEIRNPLTSIRSTVQILKRDLPEGKKTLADGVIEEVDRIDQIIQGLLSFSRSSQLHMSQVDLKELLGQIFLLLEPEIRRHRIVLEKRYDIADARITGDPSLIKQVFLNVLLNSVQAMTDGGTLTVGLSQRDSASSDVGVTVQDTGSGIPAADLQRVFDPFYTSKEAGTGLGLSISYGIVAKHGGDIDITSTTEGPQTGTTVSIRLPRQAQR